jgi:hypothetical protein
MCSGPSAIAVRPGRGEHISRRTPRPRTFLPSVCLRRSKRPSRPGPSARPTVRQQNAIPDGSARRQFESSDRISRHGSKPLQLNLKYRDSSRSRRRSRHERNQCCLDNSQAPQRTIEPMTLGNCGQAACGRSTCAAGYVTTGSSSFAMRGRAGRRSSRPLRLNTSQGPAARRRGWVLVKAKPIIAPGSLSGLFPPAPSFLWVLIISNRNLPSDLDDLIAG